MKFRVSPQSIIDIITNSSTEIYTFPSSQADKLIEQIVDTVLKNSGSDKTFKDLFEIKHIPSEKVMDDFHSWLSYEHPEKMGADDSLNPKDAWVWIKDHPEEVETLMEEFKESRESYEYSPGLADDLEVRTKDGADSGLAGMIRNVFESTEIEN